MNGVTFGTRHSYEDWGLILKSRPQISPPEPKYIYVDIPASDGQIDLTESLIGNVPYYNREIVFEFNVIDARNRWSMIYSEILDRIHGQRMKIILDEDPSYYYIGRVTVNEWESDKRTSVITITADVDPYKYRMQSTTEDWLWDPFNFETDRIIDYRDIAFDPAGAGRIFQNLTFYCERKKVIPTFTFHLDNADQVMVFHGGKFYWFNNNVPTKNSDIMFANGSNTISVYERDRTDPEADDVTHGIKGTLTVDYRNGRL